MQLDAVGRLAQGAVALVEEADPGREDEKLPSVLARAARPPLAIEILAEPGDLPRERARPEDVGGVRNLGDQRLALVARVLEDEVHVAVFLAPIEEKQRF